MCHDLANENLHICVFFFIDIFKRADYRYATMEQDNEYEKGRGEKYHGRKSDRK